MASDIILNGETVEVFGNVGIGTGSPVRKLHVEGSEVHTAGADSGFSFDDRKRGNTERWVLYAEDGKSQLWSQKAARAIVSTSTSGVAIDGSLQVTGTLGLNGHLLAGSVGVTGDVGVSGKLGIGTASPVRKLHVEGSEIHSGGAASGFSFDDRKQGQAQRWLWYAQDGQAHLWSQMSGKPILSTRNDGTLQLSGRFGIGTAEPQRNLHVVGEIHSAGGHSQTGFSFTDRADFVENPTKGERWRWYSVNGGARLWSGKDALEVSPSGSAFVVRIKGELESGVRELRGSADATMPASATVLRCRSTALSVEDPAAPLLVPAGPATELVAGARTLAAPPPPPPGPIPDPVATVPPRLALMHEFVKGQKDRLVINHQLRYPDGVRIEGNVQVTGTLTELSSAAQKENIAELTGPEAMATLMGLNAVKYNYKADAAKQRRIGFIAEEVPELVAHAGRDRISPMDVVAVLTKAVQELAAEVTRLRQERLAS